MLTAQEIERLWFFVCFLSMAPSNSACFNCPYVTAVSQMTVMLFVLLSLVTV